MIPLRTSDSISRLPRTTPFLLFIMVVLSVFAWRDLASWDFHINEMSFQTLFGLFVFPTVWSLLVGINFTWVFSPRVFLSRGTFTVGLALVSGLCVVGWSFSHLQNNLDAGFFLSDAVVGIILGMFMRGDIWGQVSTLVLGLGWIRVYDVPSYVLLFFWLFYQLIGMLIVDSPWSELRMIYWVPFFSFGWGFFFESLLRLKSQYENRNTSTRSGP